MPRPNSLDDGFEFLPKHIGLGMGVDRSWSEQSKCREVSDTRWPWLVQPLEKVKVGKNTYDGESLIALALMTCQVCPVQYDCARFGIETEAANWGTWGCHPRRMKWLRKQPDMDRIIDRAEYAGVPLDKAISTAMVAPPQRRPTAIAV
jgi:hypothetical protein